MILSRAPAARAALRDARAQVGVVRDVRGDAGVDREAELVRRAREPLELGALLRVRVQRGAQVALGKLEAVERGAAHDARARERAGEQARLADAVARPEPLQDDAAVGRERVRAAARDEMQARVALVRLEHEERGREQRREAVLLGADGVAPLNWKNASIACSFGAYWPPDLR